MSTPPDPRTTPYRPDLAAAHLEGSVAAERYVEGEERQVAVPAAPLRMAPSADAALGTQALFGERLTVYEDRQGWCWAQLARDGYVGYLPAGTLRREVVATGYRVCVPATLIFADADIKSPAATGIGLGAELAVAQAEGELARLATGGFVPARHIAPLDAPAADFVAVAESLLNAPYLWGGKQITGLDCSGLIQLALQAAGIGCPRDTDMQEAALGRAVDGEHHAPRRGDLVFWKGHVGIMADGERLLHANAHHMMTVIEPFAEARARIARSAGPVTSVRRLG